MVLVSTIFSRLIESILFSITNGMKRAHLPVICIGIDESLLLLYIMENSIDRHHSDAMVFVRSEGHGVAYTYQ